MTSFIVLLRGVNVGGKNKVSMTKLKGHLNDQGFEKVTTYINSGNLLLMSDLNGAVLTQKIESLLTKNFKLDSSIIKVLVLTVDQFKAVINKKPRGFGEQPESFHSDVIFLIDIDIKDAMLALNPTEGVDRVWPGNGVVYSQRLSTQLAKSRIGKITGKSVYHSMTIRNWNTTIKLFALANSLHDISA